MPAGTPYISTDPTTGQMIATYPDGTVVPVNPAAAPMMETQPSQAIGVPQHALPGDTRGTTAPDPRFEAISPTPAGGTDGVSGSATPGRRSYGGGQDYDGGGYRTSSRYGSSYGGASSTPRYADGSVPGQTRIPGGSSGGRVDEAPTYRETIYSPSGAMAGPLGVRAPDSETPSSMTRRAFDSSGRSYAERGTHTSPIYDKFAAKGQAMESKVRGMASAIQGKLSGTSSGYSSGGSSYGGSSYGGSSYGSTKVQEPKEPAMRGLAKHMDPVQAMEVGSHPTFMLPKLFPNVSGASPFYQNLASMPAAQLAMLSKRSFDGGPSDLVNAVGKFYQNAGGPDSDLPDFNDVMANLQHPGKGVSTMFEGEKFRPNMARRGESESYTNPGYVYGKEPPPAGIAATSYGTMLDAALSLLPMETAAKYGSAPGGYGSYLIDKWGGKALKRPAGKGKPINSWVGKRIGL